MFVDYEKSGNTKFEIYATQTKTIQYTTMSLSTMSLPEGNSAMEEAFALIEEFIDSAGEIRQLELSNNQHEEDKIEMETRIGVEESNAAFWEEESNKKDEVIAKLEEENARLQSELNASKRNVKELIKIMDDIQGILNGTTEENNNLRRMLGLPTEE